MRIFFVGLALALALTGCATAAQQQAGNIRTVAAQAKEQMKACAVAIYAKPEFAPLLSYLPPPENQYRPTLAQMNQETYPTPKEAKLLIALHDQSATCRRAALEKIQNVVPTIAIILADTEIAGGRITLQLVKRKITWGQAARQRETLISKTQKQLVAAGREIDADLSVENQAELAQRQQAADAFMRWAAVQQMVNAANRPVITNCNGVGGSVTCITH